MNEFWRIVIAAGLPSTICSTIIGIAITRMAAKQEEKEKAREEINVLLIQCVNASISLGEAVAIAQKNGKPNGETEKALSYAKDAKHDITNFLTHKGVQSIA
jgi:predicted HTH domain antitoxin